MRKYWTAFIIIISISVLAYTFNIIDIPYWLKVVIDILAGCANLTVLFLAFKSK